MKTNTDGIMKRHITMRNSINDMVKSLDLGLEAEYKGRDFTFKEDTYLNGQPYGGSSKKRVGGRRGKITGIGYQSGEIWLTVEMYSLRDGDLMYFSPCITFDDINLVT